MQRPSLKMRLGDLLVHEGIISEAQLSRALLEQKKTGRKLGASLIELPFLTEDQLLQFLAQQLNVSFLDISPAPDRTQGCAVITGSACPPVTGAGAGRSR